MITPTRVERRLMSWAMMVESEHHMIGYKAESIDHQTMKLGQRVDIGVRGDGGAMSNYIAHHKHMAARERAKNVQQAMNQLQAYDPMMAKAVGVAFTDSPGGIISSRDGANQLGIGATKFRLQYQAGISFIAGALAVMEA